MAEPEITIEPLADAALLQELLLRRWGVTLMMFGRTWKPEDYLSLAAYDANREIVGLATYAM